jgi:hypothetical protein
VPEVLAVSDDRPNHLVLEWIDEGRGAPCFGREDRVALHQIAPLVVHAIKFGGSYAAAASDAIDRYA